MSNPIAILGAGAFGTALAHVLRKNSNNTIELWDKDEYKVPDQRSLAEVIEGAQVVCLCVCSWSARAALQSIAPYTKPDTIIVSPIKGLEAKTLKTTEEVIADVLPGRPVALLIGPMLSKEMLADQPIWSDLAADNQATFEVVQNLTSGTTLSLSYTNDVHGAALAGVLKNAYAIGGGILEALGYGNNVRGWFITTALGEMADLIEDNGGKRQTAYGLAGSGDLVATATSPLSRNRTIGEQLVMEGECTIAGEGLISFPYLMELLGEQIEQYPLLAAISSIVNPVRSRPPADAGTATAASGRSASNGVNDKQNAQRVFADLLKTV